MLPKGYLKIIQDTTQHIAYLRRNTFNLLCKAQYFNFMIMKTLEIVCKTIGRVTK